MNKYDKIEEGYETRIWSERECKMRFILSHLVPKQYRFSNFDDPAAVAIYFHVHPLMRIVQKMADGREREAIKYIRGKKLYWLDFDNDVEIEERYQEWRGLL